MHDMHVLCVVDDVGNFVGTITMNNIQRSILHVYAAEEEREEQV